jgi:hypothetical protein
MADVFISLSCDNVDFFNTIYWITSAIDARNNKWSIYMDLGSEIRIIVMAVVVFVYGVHSIFCEFNGGR